MIIRVDVVVSFWLQGLKLLIYGLCGMLVEDLSSVNYPKNRCKKAGGPHPALKQSGFIKHWQLKSKGFIYLSSSCCTKKKTDFTIKGKICQYSVLPPEADLAVNLVQAGSIFAEISGFRWLGKRMT